MYWNSPARSDYDEDFGEELRMIMISENSASSPFKSKPNVQSAKADRQTDRQTHTHTHTHSLDSLPLPLFILSPTDQSQLSKIILLRHIESRAWIERKREGRTAQSLLMRTQPVGPRRYRKTLLFTVHTHRERETA